LKAWRTESRATALPLGGDLRSQRIEGFAPVILGTIEAKVDITLVELAELLEREHGAKFAPSTVWRFLDRHAITFKKNRARHRAATARRGPAATGLVRRTA
jgi:transposase